MAKKTDVKLLEERIAEVHAAYTAMKTNDSITKNTRNTKLYKLSREERTLALIKELVSALPADYKWSESARNTFCLLTTLSEERVRYDAIEIAEGDSILDLLTKYDGRKDLAAKLTAAAEKIGCKLDYITGKVVRI